MVKMKRCQSDFLFQIAKEFADQLTTDKKTLFCKVCEDTVQAEKRSQVTQHFNTATHKRNLAKGSSSSQQLLTNMVVQGEESNESQYVNKTFNSELCDALVSGLFYLFRSIWPNFKHSFCSISCSRHSARENSKQETASISNQKCTRKNSECHNVASLCSRLVRRHVG